MTDDLDHIEECAREALATSWDRRLPQNCLDLAREVRFWREMFCRDLTPVMACTGCDYELEIDALDLLRMSDKPKPICLSCGCILRIRLSAGTEPYRASCPSQSHPA